MAGQAVPGDGLGDGRDQLRATYAGAGAGFEEEAVMFGSKGLQPTAAGAEAGIDPGGHQQLGGRLIEAAAQGGLPVAETLDHLIAGGIEQQ